MVSNIWALHEMAKMFRRDEGDRLLFPMHAVRLLCLAQKDRASDDATSWMKGIDAQGRWDEIKPGIPDYAYDKHTSQGQAMVLKSHLSHALHSTATPIKLCRGAVESLSGTLS
eukprot:COSAG02_NODE_1264_length_13544_cov_71.926441_9_plen_113_part_00